MFQCGGNQSWIQIKQGLILITSSSEVSQNRQAGCIALLENMAMMLTSLKGEGGKASPF
jgi:hypothetical protein